MASADCSGEVTSEGLSKEIMDEIKLNPITGPMRNNIVEISNRLNSTIGIISAAIAAKRYFKKYQHTLSMPIDYINDKFMDLYHYGRKYFDSLIYLYIEVAEIREEKYFEIIEKRYKGNCTDHEELEYHALNDALIYHSRPLETCNPNMSRILPDEIVAELKQIDTEMGRCIMDSLLFCRHIYSHDEETPYPIFPIADDPTRILRETIKMKAIFDKFPKTLSKKIPQPIRKRIYTKCGRRSIFLLQLHDYVKDVRELVFRTINVVDEMRRPGLIDEYKLFDEMLITGQWPLSMR